MRLRSPGLRLCAIAIAFSAIASATNVTIDFDDQPQLGVTGVVITNQYPQATFSSVPGFVNYVTTQPSFNGTPPNFLCTGPVGGSIDCAQDTFVNFTNPVDSLTFQGMGINDVGQVAQIDVFVNNLFAATIDINGNAELFNPLLIDLSGFSDVTSIHIYNITDNAGIGWDTFSFNTEGAAGVPEPTSMVLAGTGLLGLLRKLRRS